MTALSLWYRLHLKKIIRAVFCGGVFVFLVCVIIDQSVSFYVRERVFEQIDDLPYRPYAVVLGTSKYVATGKTNDYYTNRLDSAKTLIENNKVSYLLLSGDNRTLQYNEPRMMLRDLRKMGIPEDRLFQDFAGFRTLDSVLRASKVFQVPSYTIISQRFHCERALLIAKYYDINAICFVAKQPEVYLATRVREMFARVKAIFDLVAGIQPYFLREPEPLPLPNNL
ncbi:MULTISPECIES: SanA/YdcF family protein [Rodentibacter]|uniref:SanA/YdcF family protein n=1 Tax=Rodentibacter TaxID=1960084 RepID=UPI001CFE6E4F|nr:ElyC/SanA/YdcF family protein [Rodentibacter sp. JRC1]GJI56720.1 protein SanA [Rodentibacter sp. JRC1]